MTSLVQNDGLDLVKSSVLVVVSFETFTGPNCVQQIDFLLFAILLSNLFALVAFFVIDYVE